MKTTAFTNALIAAAIATAAALAQDSMPAAASRWEWTRFNPVTRLTAASFANPPAADLPWVRMNMPATADPSEIQAEIQQMHDSGIAGVEVGQGAFPNDEQLVALLTAANRYGLKVSISHGPTQNPAGYSIDAENARKSLFLGKAAVSAGATFDGPLPEPALTQGSRGGFGGAGGRAAAGGRGGRGGGRGGRGGPQATRATLVAVLAYRCTKSPCPEGGPVELDRSSLVDLSASVAGKNTAGVLGGTTAGQLRWTAPASPAGSQWQVIAFWSRGVFAQPDPFSDAGYAELIQGMEAGLSPAAKDLLKKTGGDLFYDSHSSDRGSPRRGGIYTRLSQPRDAGIAEWHSDRQASCRERSGIQGADHR